MKRCWRRSAPEGFEFHDRDVLAVTESVLARTQGNYATVEQIAADVRRKFPGGVAGIVLPILSRNRFSLLLEGISRGLDKLYIQLAYPSDEVGNHLVSLDMLDEKGIDPVTDVLSEQRYRELFGPEVLHPFTGVDYVTLYKQIAPNARDIPGQRSPRNAQAHQTRYSVRHTYARAHLPAAAGGGRADRDFHGGHTVVAGGRQRLQSGLWTVRLQPVDRQGRRQKGQAVPAQLPGVRRGRASAG